MLYRGRQRFHHADDGDDDEALFSIGEVLRDDSSAKGLTSSHSARLQVNDMKDVAFVDHRRWGGPSEALKLHGVDCGDHVEVEEALLMAVASPDRLLHQRAQENEGEIKWQKVTDFRRSRQNRSKDGGREASPRPKSSASQPAPLPESEDFLPHNAVFETKGDSEVDSEARSSPQSDSGRNPLHSIKSLGTDKAKKVHGDLNAISENKVEKKMKPLTSVEQQQRSLRVDPVSSKGEARAPTASGRRVGGNVLDHSSENVPVPPPISLEGAGATKRHRPRETRLSGVGVDGLALPLVTRSGMVDDYMLNKVSHSSIDKNVSSHNTSQLYMEGDNEDDNAEPMQRFEFNGGL